MSKLWINGNCRRNGVGTIFDGAINYCWIPWNGFRLINEMKEEIYNDRTYCGDKNRKSKRL